MITAASASSFDDSPIERYLPAWLSGVAGMVDVIGWMLLGGLFTAHVTGNLVVMAADAFAGHGTRPAQILAVPVFVLATAGMSLIVHTFRLSNGQRETLLLFVQTVLLAVAAVLAQISRSDIAVGAVAMLAVSAMASQNALLHLSRAHVPTTAVMTGNIVACTLALVNMTLFSGDDGDAAREQWRATWTILAGFLAGCLIGAAAVLYLANAGWFVAALASLVIWIYRSIVLRRLVCQPG